MMGITRGMITITNDKGKISGRWKDRVVEEISIGDESVEGSVLVRE